MKSSKYNNDRVLQYFNPLSRRWNVHSTRTGRIVDTSKAKFENIPEGGFQNRR